jgi:DNA-binding IclR family transcriptional regulator
MNTSGKISADAIVKNLYMDKSSVSRILKVLELRDFIYYEKDSKNIRLNKFVQYNQNAIIKEKAQSLLEEIFEVSDEITYLVRLESNKLVFIDSLKPNHSLNVEAKDEMVDSIHSTSLGKLFIAYDLISIDSIVLNAYTIHTITDKKVLEKEIKDIKLKGLAYDNEEFILGVRCVSMPLFDKGGEMIAAIGVSMPLARYTEQKMKLIEDKMLSLSKSFKF